MFAFPLLAKRLGPERLVVFGALAFALRSLGWALAPTPLLLLAVAPLGGFGFAFVAVGTVSYVARAVAPAVRTTALGIFSGTTFLMGTILGSVIGGQVAGALRLEGMFAVASAGTVVGAGVVWWAVASSRARLSTADVGVSPIAGDAS
jgi:predicted MFS family arabinose efflux permease